MEPDRVEECIYVLFFGDQPAAANMVWFFFYRLEFIINIWGSIQLRINIPYYFLSADSIKSQQRSYEGKLLLLLPLITANFVRDTFTECC